MHLMHLLMESVPTAPTCGSTACLPQCAWVWNVCVCVIHKEKVTLALLTIIRICLQKVGHILTKSEKR